MLKYPERWKTQEYALKKEKAIVRGGDLEIPWFLLGKTSTLMVSTA